MGLDVGHVLPESRRHHDTFVCAICQNLVDLDALVTTVCSHVFCKICLQQWLGRKPSSSTSTSTPFVPLASSSSSSSPTPLCPTCNCNLLYSSTNNTTTTTTTKTSSSNSSSSSSSSSHMMMGGHATLVQPLKLCQPLAHRVLSQILVECPLQGVQCKWKGDYGDLQSHLLSKTAHTTDDEEILQQEDNKMKIKNNSSNATTTTTDPMQVDESPSTQSSPSQQQSQLNTATAKRPSTTTAAAPTPTPKQEEEDRQAKLQQQRKKRALAASFKEEANSQFASGHYKEARSLYTKALDIFLGKSTTPGGGGGGGTRSTTTMMMEDNNDEDKQLVAALYCNRAATHLTLQTYHECIDDCQKVLDIDMTYVKAYVRISRAYIQQGQFNKASDILEGGYQKTKSTILYKDWKKAQQLVQCSAQAEQQLLQQDYATAKASFGRVLLDAPSAPHLLLGAAKADLGLGLTDSALRLTKKVLTNHPQNAEACHIRGQAAFFMGGNDVQVGMKLVQEALRLDPDSSSIKTSFRRCKQVKTLMQQAKTDSFHRRFELAATTLTQAIEALEQQQDDNKGHTAFPPKCQLYADLYTQRAEAYLRLKQYQSAIRDCGLVVYAQEDHVPAWLIKVQAYHGLGRHEQALEELSTLLGGKPNSHGHYGGGGEQEASWGANDERLRKAYENAEFLVRKQKRPDYYGLLGVSSLASEVEIKKAYKRRALELHPDKQANKSLTQQKESEKQFQLLGEGLEILCNDFTRQLYDEGYDPEAIRNRVEAAQQAAHHHGQRGFGGGNPHGHYHPHYH